MLNNPHRYIDPTGWYAADAQNFTFKNPFNFVNGINLGFKITLDTGEFTFGGGDTGAINDLTFTTGFESKNIIIINHADFKNKYKDSENEQVAVIAVGNIQFEKTWYNSNPITGSHPSVGAYELMNKNVEKIQSDLMKNGHSVYTDYYATRDDLINYIQDPNINSFIFYGHGGVKNVSMLSSADGSGIFDTDIYYITHNFGVRIKSFNIVALFACYSYSFKESFDAEHFWGYKWWAFDNFNFRPDINNKKYMNDENK